MREVREESAFRSLVTATIRDLIDVDPALPRDPSAVVASAAQSLFDTTIESQQHVWIVLSAYVKNVYDQIIHQGRKTARAIERESESDGLVLPGWEDLVGWRHKMDDGLEISVAYATLGQVDWLVGCYAKLVRENETKRRYLIALSEGMHAVGMDSAQTVEEFYQQSAA